MWSGVVVMQDHAFSVDQFWLLILNCLLKSYLLLTVKTESVVLPGGKSS